MKIFEFQRLIFSFDLHICILIILNQFHVIIYFEKTVLIFSQLLIVLFILK